MPTSRREARRHLLRYRLCKPLWRFAAWVEGPSPTVLGERLVSGTTLARGRSLYAGDVVDIVIGGERIPGQVKHFWNLGGELVVAPRARGEDEQAEQIEELTASVARVRELCATTSIYLAPEEILSALDGPSAREVP
jgi:hypothetical protein